MRNYVGATIKVIYLSDKDDVVTKSEGVVGINDLYEDDFFFSVTGGTTE